MIKLGKKTHCCKCKWTIPLHIKTYSIKKTVFLFVDVAPGLHHAADQKYLGMKGMNCRRKGWERKCSCVRVNTCNATVDTRRWVRLNSIHSILLCRSTQYLQWKRSQVKNHIFMLFANAYLPCIEHNSLPSLSLYFYSSFLIFDGYKWE